MSSNIGKIKIIEIKESPSYTPEKESQINIEEVTGGVFSAISYHDTEVISPKEIKWNINGNIESLQDNDIRINAIINSAMSVLSNYPPMSRLSIYYVNDISTLDLAQLMMDEDWDSIMVYDVNRTDFLFIESILNKNKTYINETDNEKLIVCIKPK